MRLLTLALVAALATTVAAPVAIAAHMGPCWHEYVDIGIYVVQNYKNGGVKTGLQYAGNCVDGTIGWLCDDVCYLP